MLIVGELINTSRQSVRKMVETKNKDGIVDLALTQEQTGVDYLDINCGTFMEKEPEVMEWLVKTVREVCDIPLCIDSPSYEVLKIGLDNCSSKSMINSTTFETERFNKVAPLAAEFGAKLIALCIDDNGMPNSSEDRVRIANEMITRLNNFGLYNDDIYIDPLIKPISAGINNGIEVLHAIPEIIKENPGIHFICGLTNISFNLPARKVINKTFMIQTMTMGMDSYIIDLTNKEVAGALLASNMLLGKDKYCKGYIKAYRNGIYG
ncbi:MAG: dihydropteroate synthase [Eubacteriales bacterium]